MRSIFTLSLLSILLGLTACKIVRSVPISEQVTQNNQTYTVDYLFEHDGCKVYRFADKGSYVYFTSCCGETINQPDSARVIRNTTIPKN